MNLFSPTDAAVADDTLPIEKAPRLWMPKRVVFTAEAINEPFGQKIYERISGLHLAIEILKNNRITGLRGETERDL